MDRFLPSRGLGLVLEERPHFDSRNWVWLGWRSATWTKRAYKKPEGSVGTKIYQLEQSKRANFSANEGGKFGVKTTATKLDVTDTEQVNSWVSDTVVQHGRLDGAANIAGIALGDGQITEGIVRENRSQNPRLPC